jgi:hypothetical protein
MTTFAGFGAFIILAIPVRCLDSLSQSLLWRLPSTIAIDDDICWFWCFHHPRCCELCCTLASSAIAYYTTSGIKEELARPLYSFLGLWSQMFQFITRFLYRWMQQSKRTMVAVFKQGKCCQFTPRWHYLRQSLAICRFTLFGEPFQRLAHMAGDALLNDVMCNAHEL